MVLLYKDLEILRRGRLREQHFHTTFSKVVRAGESGSFWREKVEKQRKQVLSTVRSFIFSGIGRGPCYSLFQQR